MFVVMGATGHVGAAVADELLLRGQEVTILTRHPDRVGAWQDKGARVAAADAEDVNSLRQAFRSGKRAFLLNPPADPSGDTDATERRTIANILAALEGCGLEKVVAASTYGAQPGDAIGDLSTLWELEEGIANSAHSCRCQPRRLLHDQLAWLRGRGSPVERFAEHVSSRSRNPDGCSHRSGTCGCGTLVVACRRCGDTMHRRTSALHAARCSRCLRRSAWSRGDGRSRTA